MTYDDSQVLAEVNYASINDRRIKDDLKKAIDSRDRDFLAQVVARVLRGLNRTVSDFRRFVDTAYTWFKTTM